MNRISSRQISTEILCAVEWLAACATRPTLYNLMGGGTSSLQRQLYRLEEQELIEKTKSNNGEWLYALTERGRKAAREGDDPVSHWNRPWNGTWHLLLFDLASGSQTERKRLWRSLKANQFGCLRRSVWIAPDIPPEVAEQLEKASDDPKSVILLETRQPQGRRVTNQELAEAAWDFAGIQTAYRHHLALLKTHSASRSPKVLMNWLLEERRAWKDVLNQDPLLPKELYPSSFSGFEVHRKRTRLIAQAKKKLKT